MPRHSPGLFLWSSPYDHLSPRPYHPGCVGRDSIIWTAGTAILPLRASSLSRTTGVALKPPVSFRQLTGRQERPRRLCEPPGTTSTVDGRYGQGASASYHFQPCWTHFPLHFPKQGDASTPPPLTRAGPFAFPLTSFRIWPKKCALLRRRAVTPHNGSDHVRTNNPP